MERKFIVRKSLYGKLLYSKFNNNLYIRKNTSKFSVI